MLLLWRQQAPSLRRVSRRSKGRLAVVPKNGAAAQAARSVARDPRLPSWMQPSRLPGPPGPRIALCAAAFRPAAAGPRLLRLCRGAPGCGADHPKSAFAASSHHGGLGVAPARRLRAPPLGAPAWAMPFLFKLSEQIVRTANLDSKLKVEVCVRTGPSLCQNRAYAST